MPPSLDGIGFPATENSTLGPSLRRLLRSLGRRAAGFLDGFALAFGFVQQVALVVVQVAVEGFHAAA